MLQDVDRLSMKYNKNDNFEISLEAQEEQLFILHPILIEYQVFVQPGVNGFFLSGDWG